MASAQRGTLGGGRPLQSRHDMQYGIGEILKQAHTGLYDVSERPTAYTYGIVLKAIS